MNNNLINRKEAIKKSVLFLSTVYGFGSLTYFLEGCGNGFHLIGSFSVSNEEEKVIAEIAEIFIPKTETLGAKDLKIEKFIISMIQDCFGIEIKDSFLGGLQSFMKKAESINKNGFLNLSQKEREDLVESEEKKSFDFLSQISLKVLHQVPSFFQLMKELTVLGFCTSEEGATKNLVYLPVPGQYHGCMDLAPGQKAWAISK